MEQETNLYYKAKFTECEFIGRLVYVNGRTKFKDVTIDGVKSKNEYWEASVPFTNQYFELVKK